MFAFTCRTQPPWEEVCHGFQTSAGLRTWLNQIMGDAVSWGSLAGVREWMKCAKEGDVVYMDSDFRLIPQGMGDFEIRCN